jgi:hypothetical protein
MREVLSLFVFSIGAFCFVVFVTVFTPDAASAVFGPTKSVYCNTEVFRLHSGADCIGSLS